MDLETHLLQAFARKSIKNLKIWYLFYLNLWDKSANFYFFQSTLLGMKVINILEENNAQEVDPELCNNATNVISLKEIFLLI